MVYLKSDHPNVFWVPYFTIHDHRSYSTVCRFKMGSVDFEGEDLCNVHVHIVLRNSEV